MNNSHPETPALRAMSVILLISFAFVAGVVGLSSFIHDRNNHPANIFISGKINGQWFDLFSATRLRRHFTSAVILAYRPYTIDVFLTPEGQHRVRARFDFFGRGGIKTSGTSVLSTTSSNAVALPLTEAPANTRITATLITG